MKKDLSCLALSLLLLGGCDGGNGGGPQKDPSNHHGSSTDTDTDAGTDEPGSSTDTPQGPDRPHGTDTDTDEDPVFDPENPLANYSDTKIRWRGITGTAAVSGPSDNLRTYTLTTTADLRWIGDDRNNFPAKTKSFTEGAGQMRLRSGHTYLDALWALAMDEAAQDSVSSLSNWSFGGGSPMACDCFDTGENWNYVWTRDTAYSMDLGMAFMDPVRSMNSLLFKVSDLKTGGSPQIVQDTGSGGSWPISTDRVIWSLGAYETLKYLDGTTRQTFMKKAFEAISNTLEADREVIFDPKDGLYTGEQSYLDWRENTYQSWTSDDVVHIGMSKSFSTNTAHYITMLVATELAAELKDLTRAQRYIAWAEELRSNMRSKFYDESKGLFSSMTGTYLDPSIHSNYDSLGQSLAILWDAATIEQGRTAMANYPLVEAGPPVIWPQQPKTRIYHNRSIWPFVTAYHLRAALKTGNAKAVDNAFISLVRGAAFNLSNMENFEFSTLQAWYDDNGLDYQGRQMSGPNINSRRQLWSVAGFMSAVLYGIFGMDATLDKLMFKPQITALIRNQFLAGVDELTMENMAYRGKKIKVTIKLPPLGKATDGFYKTASILLNGNSITEAFTADDLSANNEIVITLAEEATGTSEIKLKSCTEDAECYAPQMPAIPDGSNSDIPYGIKVVNGKIQVSFTTPSKVAADLGNTYNVYRDGKLVGSNVSSPWTDLDSSANDSQSYCYSVTAVNKYGNESHHAKPLCYWGEDYVRADNLGFYAGDNNFSISVNGYDHNRNHFADWGKPEDVITLSNVKPSSSGEYLLLLVYGNGRDITGGVTCGVKKVEVSDASGNVVASDVVIMPHLGYNNWDRWGESSYMPVALDSSKTYSVKISDVFNMSYFDHFTTFANGDAQSGGGTSGNNRINLAAVRFLQKTVQ